MSPHQANGQSEVRSPGLPESDHSRKLTKPKRPWMKRVLITGLIVGAASLAWSQRNSAWSQITKRLTGKTEQTEGFVKETAKKGVFQITVVEKGALDSMKNAVLTSKVEGSVTIISIVTEGTPVKAGDLVCELDSSALVDKETQQDIVVEKAKAAYAQGIEDLNIQKAQNESDIAAAELKLKLAEIDLRKYKEGDLVQSKNDIDSQIKMAEANLARAQDSYEFVKQLAKKGYRTQTDIESERISVENQKIVLELALGSKRVLEKFTEERTLAELEANVNEYKREIVRTEAKTRGALSQKMTELNSRKKQLDVESMKLERIRQQIKSCKIYATQDGQVVYANTRDGRAQEQVMIDVGVGVRERQAIINIPDLDFMKVTARIHESRIKSVRPGMTVVVKVDAYPEETFHGEVDWVASVPSSTGGFGNTAKEYEAIVKITDEPVRVNKLRPGLNANVEVLVDRRDDVLQIPMVACVTVGAKQFVFVNGKDGERPHVQPIKVGQTNANFVEVVEGIEEGTEVIMNPYTHFKKEISELEAEQAKEQSKEAAKPPEIVPLRKPADNAGESERSAKPGEGAKSSSAPDRPTAGADRATSRTPGSEGQVAADRRPRAEGPPQGGERPPGTPGEGGGRPPGGGGGFDPMARFNAMDKDQDGKVSKDEAEGRMAENFSNFDSDSDGNVTKEEFMEAMAKFRGGGGGRPRPAEAGGN